MESTDKYFLSQDAAQLYIYLCITNHHNYKNTTKIEVNKKALKHRFKTLKNKDRRLIPSSKEVSDVISDKTIFCK